jgi:Protein of unknown function (DUF3626)
MTFHAAAIDYVEQYARARSQRARQVIDEVCAMSNIAPDAFAEAVSCVRQHARVALHFHPDRPDERSRTVAENLLESGRYKSQFETRISNGGLSAFPGGLRDEWERTLFGGAYHADGVDAAHRPKYGALDLMRHADGASPRFGSCYLLLSPEVSKRCTFTYLDSHQLPLERGTYAELDDILAALFWDAFTRECVLGRASLRPPQLLDHLRHVLPTPLPVLEGLPASHNLDHYVEAQVHGDVLLAEHADVLVADPSFQGTQTGRVLDAIGERYEVDCRWHCGFELLPREVPDNFRGPKMPSLAERVAVEGKVHAAAIGAAVRALRQNPSGWEERGNESDVLQELKLLWHVVLRFGRPARESGSVIHRIERQGT